MTFVIQEVDGDRSRECDSRSEAESIASDMEGLGLDVEIVQSQQEANAGVSGEPSTDGGAATPDVVTDPPNEEPTTAVNPATLSKNPIEFLRSVNSEFVNTIKGTPAISKRGFRFIQREFEINTESEVVEWSNDPLGCVVWAKAELPSGYSAEAHGEGWQFESGVSDNEFVRYADTRAKNRAISDLTSAGALAVSELKKEAGDE